MKNLLDLSLAEVHEKSFKSQAKLISSEYNDPPNKLLQYLRKFTYQGQPLNFTLLKKLTTEEAFMAFGDSYYRPFKDCFQSGKQSGKSKNNSLSQTITFQLVDNYYISTVPIDNEIGSALNKAACSLGLGQNFFGYKVNDSVIRLSTEKYTRWQTLTHKNNSFEVEMNLSQKENNSINSLQPSTPDRDEIDDLAEILFDNNLPPLQSTFVMNSDLLKNNNSALSEDIIESDFNTPVAINGNPYRFFSQTQQLNGANGNDALPIENRIVKRNSPFDSLQEDNEARKKSRVGF
ncbi:hypothetical protein [Legionella fairfieldensis]|uniref:hypothetical protein n=1 Tax=Legionella fairfieldensis TaxID=45064 RepID=UPI00048DC897|nr:hypothetical protein [Legionella fairfieldensis]